MPYLQSRSRNLRWLFKAVENWHRLNIHRLEINLNICMNSTFGIRLIKAKSYHGSSFSWRFICARRGHGDRSTGYSPVWHSDSLNYSGIILWHWLPGKGWSRPYKWTAKVPASWFFSIWQPITVSPNIEKTVSFKLNITQQLFLPVFMSSECKGRNRTFPVIRSLSLPSHTFSRHHYHHGALLCDTLQAQLPPPTSLLQLGKRERYVLKVFQGLRWTK